MVKVTLDSTTSAAFMTSISATSTATGPPIDFLDCTLTETGTARISTYQRMKKEPQHDKY